MAEVVAQVMDDLGELSNDVQPLFISIDPERDRELGLDEYTRRFTRPLSAWPGMRHKLALRRTAFASITSVKTTPTRLMDMPCPTALPFT